MVRIREVSSYPGFKLSRSNCIENSTPKPTEECLRNTWNLSEMVKMGSCSSQVGN